MWGCGFIWCRGFGSCVVSMVMNVVVIVLWFVHVQFCCEVVERDEIGEKLEFDFN